MQHAGLRSLRVDLPDWGGWAAKIQGRRGRDAINDDCNAAAETLCPIGLRHQGLCQGVRRGELDVGILGNVYLAIG